MLQKSKSSLLKAHSRSSFSRLILENAACNGPSLMNSSSSSGVRHGLLFRLTQCLVFAFRLITPMAYIYLSLCICLPWHVIRTCFLLVLSCLPLLVRLLSSGTSHSSSKQDTLIIEKQSAMSAGDVILYLFTLWMCVEALFFLYYWYLFRILHNSNDGLKHLATDRESRMKLVRDCIEAMYCSAQSSTLITPEQYIRKVSR